MRSTTGLYQPSTGSCIQSNIGLTTLSLDLSSHYNWFLVYFWFLLSSVYCFQPVWTCLVKIVVCGLKNKAEMMNVIVHNMTLMGVTIHWIQFNRYHWPWISQNSEQLILWTILNWMVLFYDGEIYNSDHFCMISGCFLAHFYKSFMPFWWHKLSFLCWTMKY